MLGSCERLTHLWVAGNPCASDLQTRNALVAMSLLHTLDGKEISHNERIATQHKLAVSEKRYGSPTGTRAG